MLLSDKDILSHRRGGFLDIKPWNPDKLGTNSYDLSLGRTLLIYGDEILDCKFENSYKYITIPDEGFVLQPGELYLGSTREWTTTASSGSIAPMLEGKSSLARLGICVHLTAGFGDAGFEGHWTLEITCVKPVKIYYDMPIAQIYWMQMMSPSTKSYANKHSAKYHSQIEKPVASKMHLNF